MRTVGVYTLLAWCAGLILIVSRSPANEVVETVIEGASVTLSAEFDPAIGPFYYQWSKDGVMLPEERGPTLRFAAVQISDAGAYRVYVTNPGGTANSAPAILRVAPVNPSRISNFSLIATGSPLVVGFGLAEGTASSTTPFSIRAAGPALEQFGVVAFMRDPRLQVIQNGALLAENDHWGNWAATASTPTTAYDSGAFAFVPGSRDAALRLTLSSGNYTVQVNDSEPGRGAGLVELFDLSPKDTQPPRLTNISARLQVAPDDQMIIAGFTISGDSPVRVMARAVGPTLAQFGVSSPLPDPTLTLHREHTTIGANANWREGNTELLALAARHAGAFPLSRDSQDAALIALLAPGSYTLRLENPGNGSGTVLLELYEVP